MFKKDIASSQNRDSRSSSRLAAVCLLTAGLATSLALPVNALAQSGRKSVPQGSYQPAPTRTAPVGNQSKAAAASVALDGYCPVCIIALNKWVKGSPEHQVTYDGKTYLFPDANVKKKFLADPARWVPAMGGDCTVCKVNMGKTVAGNIQFSSLFDDRLYLFPGEKQKQEFAKNPEKFANADVALGGKCSVCRVEMNQDVDGNPAHTTFYRGKRYWFPGTEQQSMFAANPAKYAE